MQQLNTDLVEVESRNRTAFAVSSAGLSSLMTSSARFDISLPGIRKRQPVCVKLLFLKLAILETQGFACRKTSNNFRPRV